MTSVVIVSAKRTAVGTFGGGLKDVAPTSLGATAIGAALESAQVQPDRVGHVVMGNVIHTEPRDMYLARVASIEAGVSTQAPALTLNRLCGSGLQAIVSASQSILLGDSDCTVAGGSESMSRSPFASPTARFGQKMGDVSMTDMMVGALTDPFGNGHMGITAENVAEEHSIDRAKQDAFAVESHRRASAAIDAGHFADQIVPVSVKTRKGSVEFATDEHVRRDVKIEDLASLRPVFRKDGSVTAGNASGINDGAAALVLMSEKAAEAEGKTPIARVVGYDHAGVDPSVMGVGPIPAVQKVLARTGLKVSDIDVIESNEAFAAQACAVSAALEFDPVKVNPNGGAIALGHPIGATGAIITVKLIHELHRIGGRYGLATMCIGGGQGVSLILEAL